MSDRQTNEFGGRERRSPGGAGAADVVREQVRATRHATWEGETIEPLPLSELEQTLDSGEVGAAAEVSPLDGQADAAVRIGGYRVLREISRGGQATVFQAVYEPTGREVAVKVMSGGPYITARNRDRFEREVKILGALDHPGVVRVIDRGRTADGSFFFSMDYVDGEQLDDWLAERRRAGAGQRDVVGLMVKLLDALEAAHRRGVVHRDVKPSNVRVDGSGEPRVLDFGLARLTAAGGGEREERWRTQTGHVVGSLPWASPEQAAGELDALGPATDVYSVGVVLYHALAGRWPYELAGTLLDKAATIRGAVPQALRGAAGPFGVVDAELAGVVMRALRKSPQERYATAGAMADALRAWMRGDAVVVGYQPPAGRAGRWRSRLALWAAPSVMLVAAVGGVTAWQERWRVPAAPPLPDPVQLPRLDNSVGMELVGVPAGRFLMGSPTNEPGRDAMEQVHRVNITRRFYLARTETTRGQWRRVMGAAAGQEQGDDDGLPVGGVTRSDAGEFCRRLSEREPGRTYRLPTEAEWEYACRAGGRAMFGDAGPLGDYGWFSGNSAGMVRPVGGLRANWWGLYDMNGNVAEWCADSFSPFLGFEEKTDPHARDDNGLLWVVKGGNYLSTSAECRAAARVGIVSAARQPGLGFRVAMEAAQDAPVSDAPVDPTAVRLP